MGSKGGCFFSSHRSLFVDDSKRIGGPPTATNSGWNWLKIGKWLWEAPPKGKKGMGVIRVSLGSLVSGLMVVINQIS